MKAFTDIEQSRVLVGILSIEGADMYYFKRSLENCYYPIPSIGNCSLMHDNIPCWSLTALLGVLPKNIGRYTKSLYWFDEDWHCGYGDEDFEGLYDVSADNPVDACVEMILKLHKEGLL